MRAVRDWQQRNGDVRIDLAYQGRADPAWYGVNYSPLIEPTGEKYVAISQMFLTGSSLHMATPSGTSPFVTLAAQVSFDRLLHAGRRRDVQFSTEQHGPQPAGVPLAQHVSGERLLEDCRAFLHQALK